jgi:hypothetical protein
MRAASSSDACAVSSKNVGRVPPAHVRVRPFAGLRGLDPMSAEGEARGHQIAVGLTRIAGELAGSIPPEEVVR